MSEKTVKTVDSNAEDNKDGSPSEPVEVPSLEDAVNPEHAEDDDPESNVGEEVNEDV